MTFIASVIAKNGVALIADSLVTATSPIMDLNTFLDYLQSKGGDSNENITFEPSELFKLFKTRAAYTKNYEDKLFQIDKYTAVTTAGSAVINGKRINKIVELIIDKISKDKKHSSKTLEEKVKFFCDVLSKEVVKHLEANNNIDSTTFIYTHYDKTTSKTHIYKIKIFEAIKDWLSDKDYVPVWFGKSHDLEKVVCDGQNKISERILFGNLFTVPSVLKNIVEKVTKDFHIDSSLIPENYIKTLSEDESIQKFLYDGVNIAQISELSLQQAVDLASLLMRIEVDFQTYTENIPTVGGVIKIAVINKNGFEFLNGHEITKPLNI